MHALFWLFGLALYVGLIAVMFGLLYLCIKNGVKNGIIEARRELEKKDQN